MLLSMPSSGKLLTPIQANLWFTLLVLTVHMREPILPAAFYPADLNFQRFLFL